MKRTVVKLLCALTCVVVLSACKTAGPVIHPEPQPVKLQPMPIKPQPKGASTARRELLQQPTPTPR